MPPVPNHVVESLLATTWPVEHWANTRQLVAVSGGGDSVALLRALLHLAPQSAAWLDVAHYNHGWRGAASDADEAFVRKLCHHYQLRLFVGHAAAEGKATSSKRSEESARGLRYRFLTQTAYRCGARYVLTAHTASDRVETLLHNLFRGTGLAGVAGPSLTRPLDRELVLVRPLIGCLREQIEDYLRQLGQDYCSDESNHDTNYARNQLRHCLLPQLRETYGSQVDSRLLSFSQVAEEAVETLRSLAVSYLDRVAELRPAQQTSGARDAEEFQFPTDPHLPTPWAIVHQALNLVWQERNWPLQEMSRTHWEAIRERHAGRIGELPPLNLPGGGSLRVEGEWLIIRPPRNNSNPE